MAVSDCEAEVSQVDLIAGPEKHVRRLDIPVQHPRTMRGPDGGEHRQPGLGRPGGPQRPVAGNYLTQGRIRHELHDQPRALVMFDDVVHADDAGMREPRRGSSLAQDAFPDVGAFPLVKIRRPDRFLDRNSPGQERVFGRPDDTHAATADHAAKPVPAG